MHENHRRILDALDEDPAPLIRWAAYNLIALGAKSEWDMDDNFHTTESLASLAEVYGLPSAGDQGEDALRFYGEAAKALGLRADIENEEEWQ